MKRRIKNRFAALATGAAALGLAGALVAQTQGPTWKTNVTWKVPQQPQLSAQEMAQKFPAPDSPYTWQGVTTNRVAGTNAQGVAMAGVTRTGKPDVIHAANLIYAGSKSSVCFSGKFLSSLGKDSHIETDPEFTPTRLADDKIYEFPFAVMTGEGTFTLLEQERRNLASYLKKGGFLLASAGCSSPEWNRSFRAEIAKVMPDAKLQKLLFEHPIYHTIFSINSISLSHGGTTQLEGLEVDGRIVLIYSPEGLNDTSNVKGCCCCGGNEVKNSREINVNIFAYAVMH